MTEFKPGQPKNVLITGSKRVGADLALRLAGRGANVAMTYRSSQAEIEKTVEKVVSSGLKAIAIKADLSDPDQARNAVNETIRAFGRIDVLVNMASIFLRTPFEQLRPSDFQKNIDANLAGPYYTAVAAGQAMLTRIFHEYSNFAQINDCLCIQGPFSLKTFFVRKVSP